MRIAYVNGRYVPYHHATIPMEDRGYQFADGLYEVVMFYHQRFLDWDLHMERLHHSLEALRIAQPVSFKSLHLIAEMLLRKNPYADGYIYMQITRGTAPRNHLFPANTRPSLTMSVMPAKPTPASLYETGIKVITLHDERWGRCDIKSIALLPNVLARQAAHEAQAREVFMFNHHDELTEGSLSTAYIVKDGTVYTHPRNHAVLHGVRKEIICRLCHELNIPYQETMIPRQQVMQADEAFMSSANSHVLPVTRIDDTVIGTGNAGIITCKLLEAYQQHVTSQTGKSWN